MPCVRRKTAISLPEDFPCRGYNGPISDGIFSDNKNGGRVTHLSNDPFNPYTIHNSHLSWWDSIGTAAHSVENDRVYNHGQYKSPPSSVLRSYVNISNVLISGVVVSPTAED
jgi:hypothetical protein